MKIAKIKDEEILRMLHCDRAAGFRALFDIYYTPLCLFSLQITDDFDASEDIVQTFFIHFWEKDITLDANTRLRPYLFTAIRNNTLLYIKRNHNLGTSIGEISNLSESLLQEFMELEDNQEELACRENELYQALQTLSDQERKVLEQVVIEEKSYKEVAEVLGISVNTMKTHLRRAMKKLRFYKLLSPIISFLVF